MMFYVILNMPPHHKQEKISAVTQIVNLFITHPSGYNNKVVIRHWAEQLFKIANSLYVHLNNHHENCWSLIFYGDWKGTLKIFVC